jgi:hypothetical protein
MEKEIYLIETRETIRRLYAIKSNNELEAGDSVFNGAGEFSRDSEGEIIASTSIIDVDDFKNIFKYEQNMGNIASGWSWQFSDEQSLEFIEEV